jgi:hypothetical protein
VLTKDEARRIAVNIARLPDWRRPVSMLFTLKFAAFASPSLSANRPFSHLNGILKLNKIFRCQSKRGL